MKIAMILDESFPPDPRVENEATSLIKSGHDVSLFCLKSSNEKHFEVVNGINVFRYNISKIGYRLSALAHTFPLYRWVLSGKLRKFFSDVDFDVVHVHDMRAAYTVWALLKNTHVITVLDLHENRPEIMKFYDFVRQLPGRLLIYPKRWKKMEHFLVNAYDNVCVVTDEAKDYLVSKHKVSKDKIVVYPNTVQPRFYTNYTIDESITNRFEKNYVLFYLGNTDSRRGLSTVIRAIDEIKLTIPNLMFVIVGKSKYDVKLREIVKELDLESYVSFEGYKDMSEIPSYLSISNICLSPLTRNIHHDTTYANKIFQYMSFGVPVLVSDCLAQKNIVEYSSSGLVHQAENPKDFAAKVLFLYNNPKKALEYGLNGKTFIQNEFNQDITSKELLRLYETIKN